MEDNNWLGYFIFIGFIFLLSLAIYKYFIGNTTIGSWFEKSKDYKTYYYVNVFPSNDSKNYRLKGEIERIHCDDPEGCSKYSKVTRVFFPNGGFLEFDDCPVVFDKQNQCADQDNRYWGVELTRAKYTK